MKHNTQIFMAVALTILMATPLKAQHTDYIRVSGNIGAVVNSQKEDKIGLGGTLAWLTKDDFISRSDCNFITLSVSAFNNPYDGGKFVSSLVNDANDAFNYLTGLAGYRLTQKGIENGFYVEPRLGVGIGGGSYTALLFSPMVGYTYMGIDFAAFCDMGFAKKVSAVGEKQFFTVGLSVGYNIGL